MTETRRVLPVFVAGISALAAVILSQGAVGCAVETHYTAEATLTTKPFVGGEAEPKQTGIELLSERELQELCLRLNGKSVVSVHDMMQVPPSAEGYSSYGSDGRQAVKHALNSISQSAPPDWETYQVWKPRKGTLNLRYSGGKVTSVEFRPAPVAPTSSRYTP
jgi:hypothetical protein